MTDRPKKIMIVYSTAGMGHKKAALAVADTMKGIEGNHEVETVDIMEYATGFYKFLYIDLYVFLMKKAAWLWALMFYISDLRWIDVITRRSRSAADFKGLPGFSDMLSTEAPDAIVATHFLVPSIAGILKTKKGIKTEIFAVITDYGPHSYWVSRYVDKYFAGSGFVRDQLVKKGIPNEKVKVTGIPAGPEFADKKDAAALRAGYGLEESRKTVFIMSGGFGVGPVGKMLRAMNGCATDIQVIAVAGHNKELYEELRMLSGSLEYPVKIFGFTDKVAELMAVSDVMITKAGGISVTEAMNSCLPMILYGSIPGQETWNEEMLVSAGAARKASKIREIPVLADEMFASETVYGSLKKGLVSARRAQAAADISKEVLKLRGG